MVAMKANVVHAVTANFNARKRSALLRRGFVMARQTVHQGKMKRSRVVRSVQACSFNVSLVAPVSPRPKNATEGTSAVMDRMKATVSQPVIHLLE
jgi:hypothetical protein